MISAIIPACQVKQLVIGAFVGISGISGFNNVTLEENLYKVIFSERQPQSEEDEFGRYYRHVTENDIETAFEVRLLAHFHQVHPGNGLPIVGWDNDELNLDLISSTPVCISGVEFHQMEPDLFEATINRNLFGDDLFIEFRLTSLWEFGTPNHESLKFVLNESLTERKEKKGTEMEMYAR